MEKSNVLILYTGGTIGMIKDLQTGVLKAFDFKHLDEQIPELKRLDVNLHAISFNDPIDSSEMNPSKWTEIAEIIYSNYNNYDGFVILHGSDTMSYTASALSFMLQGLRKPVILTGSQLPIGIIRTDGKENLITSIEIAALKDHSGSSVVQEVAVYFEYSLYRGNRSSKVSAASFEAFSSPNYPDLATAGVEIKFNETALYRTTKKELSLQTQFSSEIALIKLFPGIQFEWMKAVFDINHTKGIILETFGSGNGPSNAQFISLLQDYIAQGGLVLNITQCTSGKVEQGKYETSVLYKTIGIIGGGDLTTEAAITKMMYVCGLTISLEEKKQLLLNSIVAEL